MDAHSKRTLIRLALAAGVLCTAAANPETSAKPTVLVVGDSLSAAYGIRAEESWVNLLRQRLDPTYEVVNASISGDTTGGGLARIGKTLAEYEPDIVIIELGGNDGLRGLPIRTIRDNLTAMVEAVIAAEAEPILAGMLMPPNLGPRYTQAFEQVFETVAEATGAALVPFLLEGVAASEEGLMQDDGVHPTARAQARLLENVWRVLAPMVSLERSERPASSFNPAAARGRSSSTRSPLHPRRPLPLTIAWHRHESLPPGEPSGPSGRYHDDLAVGRIGHKPRNHLEISAFSYVDHGHSR